MAYTVSTGFWSGGMLFMLHWSVVGVVFANIIGSHLEDLRFYWANLIIYEGFNLTGAEPIVWRWFGNNDTWLHKWKRIHAIYDAFPEYRYAFWLKIFMNIANIAIAAEYVKSAEAHIYTMGGWGIETEEKIEEANPKAEDFPIMV